MHLLQSDQQKSIQGAPQARPIHTSATSEGIPISLAQQQLWFFDAIETQHLANHIFTAWSLRGRLEISVLTRCFHEIIKRHQTLRTAFRGVDGVPHSLLVSDASLPLVCVDLRAILQGEREGALRHLSREASLHPFALDHAPLLRIVLVRVDDKAHALLMTAHHIIFDLPSVDIFMQELVTLYADYAQGNAASVPALPVQY